MVNQVQDRALLGLLGILLTMGALLLALGPVDVFDSGLLALTVLAAFAALVAEVKSRWHRDRS